MRDTNHPKMNQSNESKPERKNEYSKQNLRVIRGRYNPVDRGLRRWHVGVELHGFAYDRDRY